MSWQQLLGLQAVDQSMLDGQWARVNLHTAQPTVIKINITKPQSSLGKACIRGKWPKWRNLRSISTPPLDGVLVHWFAFPAVSWQHPFVHLGGERHCVSCPRTQHSVPSLSSSSEFDLQSSAPSTRPPRLPVTTGLRHIWRTGNKEIETGKLEIELS